MISGYPLATSTWDALEITAMQEVIDSGQFTMGSKVKAFEENFAKKFGAKYAVMVNSGSSANLLMIASLFYTNENFRLRRGDEVIVPAVSWSTTYYPLYQYGLKLKFVDIDLKTLNYNIEDLKKAVSSKTKAILAVNLLGNPNDYDAIREITYEHNILLLEDNCESMGAKYKGSFTGNIGMMGTFSTFFSHHISTMEGGLILTNHEELYQILICLRAHGWTRNLPQTNLLTGIKSDNLFEESFKFILPGYNLRPLELSGAIGLCQLEKLDSIIQTRRENAKKFQSIMNAKKQYLIQQEISESSWFGFSIILKDNCTTNRTELIKKLVACGIEVRPIVAGDFTKNKVIDFFKYEKFGSLKNAALLDANGFFIGNHHFHIDEYLTLLDSVL
jgi:CDP-6-deoxy-D-xylo-4-hexulose-3-dehydrase